MNCAEWGILRQGGMPKSGYLGLKEPFLAVEQAVTGGWESGYPPPSLSFPTPGKTTPWGMVAK